MARRASSAFVAKSVAVWFVMVLILILVPDALEHVVSLQIARICGWVLASGLWVAILEREWQSRFGPVKGLLLQMCVWLAAALLAAWVSDVFRVPRLLG